VGGLLWPAIGMYPDILYAVNIVVLYLLHTEYLQQKLMMCTWIDVKQIVQYLNITKTIGIAIDRGSSHLQNLMLLKCKKKIFQVIFNLDFFERVYLLVLKA
jgi:hypothetical protein